MRIPQIWAGLLACLLASPAMASTYYVDATGGSDSNNGLSVTAAWQTIAKVNGNSFAPGDQVLFKRGEVWRESLVIPSSGSSGNPITFDAYGSGEAPTITGYFDLPAAAWTLDSGNIWKATVTATGMNYVLFGGSIWGNKQTSGKSACVNPRDFFFMSNTLYVYSQGSPTSYYGSVAAMLMTTGQLIYVNGKSWITLQHFKLTYFDGYGVRIGNASDHLNIANLYSDGIIPAGTQPHGFYVNASPSPADINFYNVDAHRNYDGFRFDGGATHIYVTNCRAYGNRDKGIQDNTGSASYSYCHFYGNGIGVVESTDTNGTGSNDIPDNSDPRVKAFQRYPARITLTVDDPGLEDTSAYVDSILPEFDARGLQLGIAIVTGYALSTSYIPKCQAWINAGRDVVSHSWSHQYFTNPKGFTIQYTGTGTAATVTIAGNHLTTSVTGGPGGENMDLDLTNASYDTISELVATINGRGVYAATQDVNAMGPAHSIGLADVSSQDIKSGAYTAQFQESRLIPDEMSSSKAWMSANLAGLPSTRVYVYPGGIEDASTQGYAVTAGYAGARGALTMDLGTKDVYGRGVNIQNITSFGVDPYLKGLSAAQMDAMIASLVWKSSVWGAPYGIFWHSQADLSISDVGHLLDSLIAHGATVMTNTQLINWLTGQYPIATTTKYVSAATGPEVDFRPTAGSPIVDAGTGSPGATYKCDLEGVDQTTMGSGWEIGAYSFVSAGPYLVVVSSE